VGSTAIGLYDVRSTPVSSSGEYPGLEVHATLIDNILREDFLHKPEWAKTYDVLVILFLGLISGAIASRMGALKGFLLAVGLFISYALLNRLLFVSHGIWLNLVYPLLALVLVYVCLTVFRYFTEERERRRIRGAFYQKVKDHFECLELDSVRVKGKAEPVRIYHLMGRKGSAPWDPEAIQRFRTALERYKERRWDEAMEIFQKVVETAPGLYVSHLYLRTVP